MAGEKDEWKALAEQLFSEAGDVIVLGSLSREGEDSVYNPVTGEFTSNATTTPCRVLFDENKGQSGRYFSGATVLPDGAPVYIQGSTFTPKKGDVLTISGKQDSVVLFADDIVGLGAVSFCIVEAK